jgi:hypothetical protein
LSLYLYLSAPGSRLVKGRALGGLRIDFWKGEGHGAFPRLVIAKSRSREVSR